MRALIQRVQEASVDSTVENVTSRVGQISQGLLVLVGVTHSDTPATALKLADKIWNLRIMNDADGVMNLSVADTTKNILLVSQFTLYGDASGGRRPSWIAAAKPEVAEPLFTQLARELGLLGANVQTGRFRTDMLVSLVNDGPVTVMIEM
ncbi:MAG: D-aminoacyl-tRNA deacylase [Actinomycetes bacterium]